MPDRRVRLETERLVLRQLRPSDSGPMVDYLLRNREFHAPYEPVRPASYFTRAFWRSRARAEARGFSDRHPFRLYLFAKESPDRVIGQLSFDNMVRGAFQSGTLGYMLDERAQGQGYMTEALGAFVEYLFFKQRFHRIQAAYLVDNARSGRVLARLGFVIEGRAPAYLCIAGVWQDHTVTSLLHPEW